MGQPEQAAGASGQTREKKARRSRKKGQKPAEKASDKQVGHPEDDGLGEGAAAAVSNATKGRRRKEKAGAAKGQVGRELSAGKSAEAPPQDGGVQTFDGAGRHSGRERSGADHGGGHAAPAAGGETAPDPPEGAAPPGDSDQAGPDQKRRRNKKSKESKLLVYRRLGEYMPEEDEKKVGEVLAKKEPTEIDDKSKMAAEVDGAGDVAGTVVQSPAAPPTGALATNGDGDGEGEDTYYSILAQIQETVEQAAETLSDPTAEQGQVEVDDSHTFEFEAILKFAAAMESVDTAQEESQSPPSTPAATDAAAPPQDQEIPEVPTSRTAGEVSSSSSAGTKDSIDVDTAISHVAEKESKVPDAAEDMEADAKVQDAETLEDMSSDRGNHSMQAEGKVNDAGVTENEPKSTEELHSAGSRVGMEESCEESSIPAPPESCTSVSEVTEINSVEVTAPEQDTSEEEDALTAPSAEDPGRAEPEDEVSETKDTEATTPAVEIAPTAEAETGQVTPTKSEDDTTEALNEEDLLLNTEEGEAIAITLPRHLSEEVETAAIESDMGNKSAKQKSGDEQPASKQETVDDATGVFDDDVDDDTSKMSPDNQSNLPTSDVPANPIQTSEDEIEVEVTVADETPDSQENAEEEEATEVPNYTPPPPTDSPDPVEETRAQPKQEKAIVIGNASTLPEDIPYIDDVDEPEEEPDTDAHPAHADETTPLKIKVETAPLEIPKVAQEDEEEALIETPEPKREDEPSLVPEEKQKKKKKRSKLFSCMFPCVQPHKEKNH